MDKYLSLLVFLFVLFTYQCAGMVEAACYFPSEFQGDFVMQGTATAENGIKYDSLNITISSIPIWGTCHRRIGNNFILMNNYLGTTCIRCLHLKLRSRHVLQVFVTTKETLSKCYTNEQSAEANCPSKEAIEARQTEEILLFKTRDTLTPYITKEYCPIDGEFHVSYQVKTPTGTNVCRGVDSKMDSCPSGSTLNFRFKGCNFDAYNNFSLTFDCLGHWKGSGNENFLIFYDPHHMHAKKPMYRCALYKRNHRTGNIQIALSKDSTCKTDLNNSSNGYEMFSLTPKEEKNWPHEITYGMCNFPEWMRGDWEHVRVEQDTLIYKDHTSFKTYTIKCVAGLEENDEKFLVYSRTQCDEERYNCIKIAKRTNNILEFQLGIKSSKKKDVFNLCNEENFNDESWITQGRSEIMEGVSQGTCPITGEYRGLMPDDRELCAKLWSDCRAPELMYYQVFECETNTVYEEREYRCLGHWSESDLLYTYTQRKDVAAGTYECFVGSKMSEKEIYIIEAGEHCQRHKDPIKYGMKLVNDGLYSCTMSETTPRHQTSMSPTPSLPSVAVITTTTTPTVQSTIKQWNFDSTLPESTASSIITSRTYIVLVFVNIGLLMVYL